VQKANKKSQVEKSKTAAGDFPLGETLIQYFFASTRPTPRHEFDPNGVVCTTLVVFRLWTSVQLRERVMTAFDDEESPLSHRQRPSRAMKPYCNLRRRLM